MHPQVIKFVNFVKMILPNFFINKKVLDVGSGDINGNNKSLFTNCEYNGNDVIEAPNVTIVSRTKNLPFKNEYFDTIVSTECFEHDPELKDSLVKIYSMLKQGGLFFFTCASTGRKEHGTINNRSHCSYGTIGNIEDMMNYYKNVNEYDFNEILNVKNLFSVWDTYYNDESKDLYFIGIKKTIDSTENVESLSKYYDNFVINTSNNIN